MDFKKITIADFAKIKPFLYAQPSRICDFTSLGLYMWVDYFGYEYAIENEILYLRETKNASNLIKYMLPVAFFGDVTECVDILYKQAVANFENQIVLNCVPEESLDALASRFKLKADFTRDWSDYVYNAVDLACLQGKKFAKKRNLIHQFLSLYEYELKPVVSEIIPELLDFLAYWQNDSHVDDLEQYENLQTADVLNKFECFDLLGYAIYINNAVAGFSLCELKKNTMFVHIEKADRQFKGIYQVLNQLTISEALKDHSFDYVNREEDVGDEGLRKAKLSYYPSEILKKYEVTIYGKN